MTGQMRSRTKAVAILLAVAIVLVLLQMTSFAPLPADANDFLRGFTIGIAIAVAIGWFAGRTDRSGT